MNSVWDKRVPTGNTSARVCVEARLAAQEYSVEIAVICRLLTGDESLPRRNRQERYGHQVRKKVDMQVQGRSRDIGGHYGRISSVIEPGRHLSLADRVPIEQLPLSPLTNKRREHGRYIRSCPDD
jgi:hypothetical protein